MQQTYRFSSFSRVPGKKGKTTRFLYKKKSISSSLLCSFLSAGLPGALCLLLVDEEAQLQRRLRHARMHQFEALPEEAEPREAPVQRRAELKDIGERKFGEER